MAAHGWRSTFAGVAQRHVFVGIQNNDFWAHSFEPGAHDAFLKHWCGYTETPGAPWLRETIAQTYRGTRVPDVFVVAAEEAIFLFYHALLKLGDHAIVESPCYESALTLVQSTGATLSEWRRNPKKAGLTILPHWNLSSNPTLAPSTAAPAGSP